MTLCELCHKREATGTIWLDPDQSPIRVGGRYQVPERGFFSLQVSLGTLCIGKFAGSIINVGNFGFAPGTFNITFVVFNQPVPLGYYSLQQAFYCF